MHVLFPHQQCPLLSATPTQPPLSTTLHAPSGLSLTPLPPSHPSASLSLRPPVAPAAALLLGDSAYTGDSSVPRLPHHVIFSPTTPWASFWTRRSSETPLCPAHWLPDLHPVLAPPGHQGPSGFPFCHLSCHLRIMHHHTSPNMPNASTFFPLKHSPGKHCLCPQPHSPSSAHNCPVNSKGASPRTGLKALGTVRIQTSPADAAW